MLPLQMAITWPWGTVIIINKCQLVRKDLLFLFYFPLAFSASFWYLLTEQMAAGRIMQLTVIGVKMLPLDHYHLRWDCKRKTNPPIQKSFPTEIWTQSDHQLHMLISWSWYPNLFPSTLSLFGYKMQRTVRHFDIIMSTPVFRNLSNFKMWRHGDWGILGVEVRTS